MEERSDGPRRERPRWRFSQPSTDQVISYSRLLLASFALVATYVDPTQPTRFADLTYAILVAYVVAAAALVAVSTVARADLRWPLGQHIGDLAVFAALLYLTQGPTSPFFVFFTFAIISAALRWSAVGATATAALLLIVFVAVSALELGASADTDLNRTIVRAGNLLTVGYMLGYFGWLTQRGSQRLVKLAAWPVQVTATGDDPPIEGSLRHAAETLGVDHLIVVFEETRRTGWRTAHWNGVACEFSDWEAKVPPVAGTDAEGTMRAAPPLLERFGLRNTTSIPFQSASFRGLIVTAALGPTAPELSALTNLVARRIEFDFEHHRLRRDLSEAAVARERARLARDLHDGILQDLTAAGLHLKSISKSVPEAKRESFEDIIALLMEQQARIRGFVATMNPKPGVPRSTRLKPILEQTADAMTRQWRCPIEISVDPSDAEISIPRELQIRLIVGEAVSNAVRHGGATRIRIDATVADSIRIRFADNGHRVVTDPQDDLAPFSVVQRVRELGGTCGFEIGSEGTRLSIDLAKEASS